MDAAAEWSDDESPIEAPGVWDPGSSGSDVLERVAKMACRLAEVDEAVVLMFTGDRRGPLVPVARCGGRRSSAVLAWRVGEGAVGRALAIGAPAAGGERGRLLSAAAPILVDGQARGVLAVSTTAQARPFEPDQLELLGDLADLAASLVEERDRREAAAAVLAAGAEVLARAVDMRDDYTGRHSAQVGALATRVGSRLGMDPGEVTLLDCAARLHDVGKLAVPDAILQKPGPLDEDEWKVMRKHPDMGAEMVARVPGLEELAELVRAHHERWDGSGYPQGLAGERIPLASRVISACDAFEAMLSNRPYRAPLTADEALAELTAGSGSQFDPAVVAAIRHENEAG
jgi:hypothetical protein